MPTEIIRAEVQPGNDSEQGDKPVFRVLLAHDDEPHRRKVVASFSNPGAAWALYNILNLFDGISANSSRSQLYREL